MKKVIVDIVAAARPNFMKVAPLLRTLAGESWIEARLVHTGQHYDLNMSEAFFSDLEMQEPAHHLNVGSGTHAEQTAKVMIAYERLCVRERPDFLIVVGDVNSTLACALVAAKLGIRFAHLEAGLRSYDRSMPEEINRILVDSIADLLWTPSVDADQNLLKEGVPAEKIQLVGNIMIDSLELLRPKILAEEARKDFGLSRGSYGILTLHRPSNVDHPKKLQALCRVLIEISEKVPLVFPVHPRTKKALVEAELLPSLEAAQQIQLSEPLSYRKFMSLLFEAKMALTDSGGIQEETTYLGIPCFTLRENTERPITTIQGTNKLCSSENLLSTVMQTLEGASPTRKIPQLWDGKVSPRILEHLRDYFSASSSPEERRANDF